MTKRRGRGEWGLSWDKSRECWTAETTVGYTAAGKRIVLKARDRTKTVAKDKLRQKVNDYQDGITKEEANYTVAHAVEDWLTYGLNGRSEKTIEKSSYLCRHITSELGARKLRELTAMDVDRWLAEKKKELSTSTLKRVYECLSRAVNRAMARDHVNRNVVALCEVPNGKPGRPSKSLNFNQAKALLEAATGTRLDAYIVLSLLLGARTEELRALTWSLVDLTGKPHTTPPIPPAIQVWRSVREDGDTKTRKSRRTLALPRRCLLALHAHRQLQDDDRQKKAGHRWQDTDLVFASALGTALDAANVRRAFRRIIKTAGLNPAEWTPRELRHSFVSLLSAHGLSLEQIADLCGHAGTTVTGTVYRHQLRPVLLDGATAMDQIFSLES